MAVVARRESRLPPPRVIPIVCQRSHILHLSRALLLSCFFPTYQSYPELVKLLRVKMVFRYFIRRGYRAYQARKAKRPAGEDRGAVNENDDQATVAQRKALLKSRARLMIALAIPVFLETLDYTGWPSYPWVAAKTLNVIVSFSCRYSAASYCCMPSLRIPSRKPPSLTIFFVVCIQST